MTKARQNFDHLAWSLNEEAWKKSYKRLRLKSTCRQVESFVQDVCDQHASLVPPVTFGGYNVLYRVRCEGDGFDTIVRRPCPDLVQFPAEKTLYEAATMSYLAKHTDIPVPMLFFYTSSSSSSSEIGPAMILPYIESRRNMSDALAKPDQDPEETQVLDPGIHEEDLIRLYWRMCKLLIQLFKPSLDKIGSLVERDGNHSVAGRAITQNMDDMVYVASIPRSVFPPSSQVYQRADEWYTVSASMHMAQLLFQHNDLVHSEDDCRNKYVARYLFHSLAKKGQLSTFGFLEDNWSAQSKFLELSCSMPNGTGSFRLWCDDLRPHNILLNLSDNIEAALDWEFAYSAPIQFSLDPPWWLLLELPELWSSGIDDWSRVYDDRLRSWLLAMEDAKQGEDINFPGKLSTYMHESWLSGRFWLDYATRKSWVFDTIFWKYLDEKFFGPRDKDIQESQLWATRVHLLGEEAQRSMEMIVERKMNEAKERVLVDWDPATVKQLLQQALGD